MRKTLFILIPLIFSSLCWAEAVAESPADSPSTDGGDRPVITEQAAEALENSPANEEADVSEENPPSEAEEPAPEAEQLPALTRIELDLPGADRPETEKQRNLYLQPKWTKLLHDYFENGMEYRIFVRKAVQDAEVPQVLEYLPMVESNYNPKAKSKSGAVGLWQFMANSVYPFLTLNDFVDQRLDPWASTDAAIKKLQDNYRMFGDWTLAIAAYNCGAGALQKALNKAPAGEKNYWYLVEHNLISKQTAEYVPRLLAIADLAVNSEYYGIDLPKHDEEFEILENEKEGNFDYLTVNKAYSLTALAAELKMDKSILTKLNPSFVLGMTHPTKTTRIRLPLGMEESAKEAVTKLTPVDFPLKYTVVSGDSLWSISRKYNTTVKAICDLNNIQENAVLRIGKILYIPSK